MNKNPFVKFKNGKIVNVEHPTTASFEEAKNYPEKTFSAPKKSGIFYLITLLLVNGGIWTGAFIYLSTAKPKYISEWT
ncbi:MAG: hypothetical protein ACFCUV_18865, partial [Rivularia sp. (in: cyanobacteria)]